MALHSEAKLDQKFTEFAKLMNVYLNHFPRHEKYALTQEIRARAPNPQPSINDKNH